MPHFHFRLQRDLGQLQNLVGKLVEWKREHLRFSAKLPDIVTTFFVNFCLILSLLYFAELWLRVEFSGQRIACSAANSETGRGLHRAGEPWGGNMTKLKYSLKTGRGSHRAGKGREM